MGASAAKLRKRVRRFLERPSREKYVSLALSAARVFEDADTAAITFRGMVAGGEQRVGR